MIFIDASVFIAYDNINDVHHTKAVELMQKIEEGSFGDHFTSDYIFNEVVGVTNRKVGKERAIQLGSHILKTIFILHITNHLLKQTWIFFAKTKLTLSLVDCSTIILCENIRAEYIATFDKEFKKITSIKIVE